VGLQEFFPCNKILRRGISGFTFHTKIRCAADFYRPYMSIALAGFKPANFGSSGKHVTPARWHQSCKYGVTIQQHPVLPLATSAMIMKTETVSENLHACTDDCVSNVMDTVIRAATKKPVPVSQSDYNCNIVVSRSTYAGTRWLDIFKRCA
jgi:hypothetical protein